MCVRAPSVGVSVIRAVARRRLRILVFQRAQLADHRGRVSQPDVGRAVKLSNEQRLPQDEQRVCGPIESLDGAVIDAS
jgi:hypothetical protein